MTLLFAVVCEAAADQRTACHIADRLISDGTKAPLDELCDSRQWCGADGGTMFLPWHVVQRQAVIAGVQKHGYCDGKPGEPDAAAARNAIRLLRRKRPDLKAILLIRDSDGDRSRLNGLIQARNETKEQHCAVIIGVAHPKREAWALAGFVPKSPKERTALAALRKQLGFSPVEASHRLQASRRGVRRDAKRALKSLCPTPEREQQCWRDTPVGTLRTRGKDNGLAAYMSEVETRLLPLFTGRRPN